MNRLMIIISFLLTGIFFSCNNKFDLKSDKLLTETFNKKEIKGLESMVNYVDLMVLERTNETEINKAYHHFFDQSSRTLKDSSKFLVPFNENEKYEFLENMDTSVYNAIWEMGTTKGARYKGTWYGDLENFKNLELRSVGGYMEYLKKLGQTDEFYKTLHKNITMAGGMPASTAIWFSENHNNFDFNIPKNRLWAAIYILRIEEPFEMKMERYLNK